jgi:hypothetical protein
MDTDIAHYLSLWEKNDATTFVVVDAGMDVDLGNIVCSSYDEAYKLLDRGISLGYYTANTILVEMMSDDHFA